MAQHGQYLPGLDIIEDVKRIVLEYITFYSDLRALCLTSRAWNYVATQHIYTNIVLDIRFRNGQLSIFRRCLLHGAWKHLRYARSLSLLDIPTARSLPMSLDSRTVTEESPPWRGPYERDQLLLHVLQLFPDNKLRTFRYISEIDMDPILLHYVNKHQKLIDTIHIPQCDHRQLITPTRRHIMTGFRGTNQKTSGFVQFAQALPPLLSLSLHFWYGFIGDTSTYWGKRHHVDVFDRRKVITSELVVSGCMPQTFTSAMAHMFDLSAVTRLALFDCNMWLFLDISSSPALENLTYFQFSTKDKIMYSDSVDLKEFFQRNQNLEHVYLSLSGLASIPLEPSTPSLRTSYLWPLRHRLKTLSLYDQMFENIRDRDDETSLDLPSDSTLGDLCREHCSLQQFGLQPPLPDLSSASQTNTSNGFLLQYLEPIKLLKDLRILQLYNDRMRAVHPSRFRTGAQTANDVHQFAVRFFQLVHLYCPYLNVLVWGICGEPSEEQIQAGWELANDDGLALERASQYLFVKRKYTLDNGLVRITAVSVTPSRLRDEFPELDILAYDPGHHVLERFNHQRY